MRKFIDRVLIRSQEIIATPAIVKAKNGLRSVSHPNAGILAACIEEWLDDKFSTEEKIWLEKILAQWKKLQQRNDIITIDDFGAGVPSSSNGIKKNVTVGTIGVQNSRSHHWLPLMFKLMRELQPTTIVELGTCVGISGMYCAAGLKMNNKGTLVTIEGAKAYASIAAENFSDVSLNNVIQYTGRFSDVLPDILKNHRPIDFVFIDGHHDGDATISYFEQLIPFLSHSAWLVFDDISWSKGMKRAWKTIADDKRVLFSANLSLIGICYLER
jgi:predicted O-methyltransferase YrrM